MDFGSQPPSNSYLSQERLDEPEITYPLRVYLCGGCGLVQLPSHAGASELFTDDYAYLSSTSSSWVAHAKQFALSAIERLHLGEESLVVELASNDGYLLQHFIALGVPCYGVEPTAVAANIAESIGVESIREFFGLEVAKDLLKSRGPADLVIGNNVLAHVPDINDFVAGVSLLLGDQGTATFEFPHLMRLVEGGQFDTIYHEHFSYLSLEVVKLICDGVGLEIFDVEEIWTHGGSLRVWVQKIDGPQECMRDRLETVEAAEARSQISDPETFRKLQAKAVMIKNDLLSFLIDCPKKGDSVAAYGAAAKGNTLFNFGGVTPDLLPYVCDAASSKQGLYLPGSHIPIMSPDKLRVLQPDIVLVVPWNIVDEITDQNSYVVDYGGRFVVAVPSIRFVG